MAVSAFSVNGWTVGSSSASRFFFDKYQLKKKPSFNYLTIRASTDDADCNTEECAPDKEVIFFYNLFVCVLCVYPNWIGDHFRISSL